VYPPSECLHGFVTPLTQGGSYDPGVANGWGESELSGRAAALLAVGGGATAVASLVLAGAAGEPYLEADGFNAWLIVFAAGLLAALVAFPFGTERRLRDRYEDRDRRWEVSLLAWGAVAAVLLAVAFVAGFDTGTLAGAAGLIAAIESGLVLATIVVWLFSG
jgi:hypothetical protein